MGEFKRISCDGKVAFENFELAKGVTTRKNGKTRRPYHCRNCGKWHIGSMFLRKPKKNRQFSYE